MAPIADSVLGRAGRIALLCASALAITYCGEQGRFTGPSGGSSGGGNDVTAPTAQVLLPGGPADTVVDITDSLLFTVRMSDSVRLGNGRIRVRGLATFALDTILLDTVFPAANNVKSFDRTYKIGLPVGSAGQRLAIVAFASDGAGNSTRDSINVRVDDPQPPSVELRSPASGVSVPNGGTLAVVARAVDPSGVARMGTRLFFRNALNQPITISGDSATYASNPTTFIDTFTVAIPDSLNPGPYTVHAFAVDGSVNSNAVATPEITITVVDTALPFGNFLTPASNSNVVAGDSILVTFRGRDLTGVRSIELTGVARRGDPSLGTDQVVTRFTAKTVNFTTRPRDTTITRYLNAVLTDSTVEKVYLEALVTDVAGNTRTIRDSIQIVAGPFVQINSPATGAALPVGVPISLQIQGRDPDSLRYIGYTATGILSGADSAAIAANTITTTSTLSFAVPATTANGSITFTPFARDRFGNRFVGRAIAISLADTVRPVVNIQSPAAAFTPVAAGDSFLVQVLVQDNRGVASVAFTGEALRGDATFGTLQRVPRFQPVTATISPTDTDTLVQRWLRPVLSDSSSETVYIVTTATDADGNSQVDTATVRIVSGPAVALLRPTSGATTSPGKSIVIEVRAVDANGVRLVGWRASGVVTAQDSVFRSPVAGNLADTAVFADTLLIPGGTPLGSFTITPFAVDSLGDPSGFTSGVTVSVQSAASDATPPSVTFTIARRIETDDTISVRATDPGGIRRVGWTVRRLDNSLINADSTVPDLNGTLTDVTRAFVINLPDTLRFPSQVVIQAFAVDSVNNRATTAAETLTVVAGKTYSLPAGSVIADAIYNRNRRELYLSNITFDRIEVFSLATNSFVASIPVGSRPWGLSMWPRDTAGAYADTLIVANSGGTNLSIVDMVSRAEVRRHRLPNYHIQSVKTSTTNGGGVQIDIVEYEVSDRPQYVAATCRVDGAGNCVTVLAVYSTTPTPAQTGDLANRGYVAWDNLSAPGEGHLFWEPSEAGTGDSLQLIATRFDTGSPVDTILVGAGSGIIVNILETLTFQDSTFVRASGNFLRALIGEGGTNEGFARVLMYDPNIGLQVDSGTSCALVGVSLSCHAIRDNGVSTSTFVSDFLVNRASPVRSIAINHSGRTALVRADSVYAFDVNLRQAGILQVGGSGGAVGMDFHPCNNFDANTRTVTPLPGCAASYTSSERLVFTARPDSSIDVFDTYFFGRVTDTTSVGAPIPIPIRNALIGPVRVATDAGETVLFGLTSHGLVQVRLPNVTNSLFPVRRRSVAAGGGGSP